MKISGTVTQVTMHNFNDGRPRTDELVDVVVAISWFDTMRHIEVPFDNKNIKVGDQVSIYIVPHGEELEA